MSSPPQLEVLEVRIENLEKSVGKLVEKAEKDSENNTAIREAIVKLSVLMEKQDERNEKQEKRLDQQDRKLDDVKQDIQTLRIDISAINQPDEIHTKWYQGFISSDRRNVWIVLVLLLAALLGGYKAQDLFKFIM